MSWFLIGQSARWSGLAPNSITCSFCHPRPLHKISLQFDHNVLSNDAIRQTSRQTNKQTNKQTNATENITSLSEIIRTSLKQSSLFVSLPFSLPLSVCLSVCLSNMPHSFTIKLMISLVRLEGCKIISFQLHFNSQECHCCFCYCTVRAINTKKALSSRKDHQCYETDPFRPPKLM